MRTLTINLKYCYGINSLDTELDFSQRRTCAIYSPNGVMKTSFAKTFKDLANNQNSKDQVFPDRKTARIIKDENGDDIKSEEIFVIEPYNEQFSSDKLSTLLVTKDLKKEYDNAYSELEIEKNNFIKKLKNVSQSTDCEYEFVSTFAKTDNDNFFELLCETTPKLDGKQIKYNFRYNDVFDKKGNVKNFLSTHQESLDLYVENYESLISQSKIFKKSDNTFGTYQAGEILKSVSDNSFFEAGHYLELTNNTKIESAKDFKNLLEAEIKKVIGDEKLKGIFQKIDTAISSNVELRAFKSVIEKNNLLLVELKDYENFKVKVWLGYLDQLKSDIAVLVEFYSSRKKQLEAIVSKAKDEETDWERSIKEFNERFKGLPFKLSIKNKEDVMLKTSTPTVEFVFHDNQDERVIERGELLAVLSQGERRALYLLNIIFEVQARKKGSQKTIFIADDIADSFDYKNKYAIIEYLNDISQVSDFYQIILTHNFDFFRTLEARDVVPYPNCYFTRKSSIQVFIEKAIGNIRNPFINDWKKHLDDNKKLIASIPFIRNIIEYTRGEEDVEYKKLTSLLHWKKDTETILISELKLIFEHTINNITFPDTGLANKIVEKIFEETDMCLTTDEGINFENKIVLSIAIRLKAETFMINAINDPSFTENINKNQTIRLIHKYKELFPANHQNNDILEQVNLMTPENIHLNSFMYEPILDLGEEHLKDLYIKVKNMS